MSLDYVTSAALDVKVQEALTPYRTRADEDVLLAQKATTATTSGLQAQITTLGDTVAQKADAVAVYTKETTDLRITTAVAGASSAADDAVQAVAHTLSDAVAALNQNLANAQGTLNARIDAKVSTDAWPGLVQQLEAASANAANAAIAQTTQDVQDALASKAPLASPDFTGSVSVGGQAVVLTNDPRMSLRGPTGPQGVAGAVGAQGLQGVTGPQGLQGNAGAAGSAGVTGSRGPTGSAGSTGPAGGGGGSSSYAMFALTTENYAAGFGAGLYLNTSTVQSIASGITLSTQPDHSGIVFSVAGVYVVSAQFFVQSNNSGGYLYLKLERWESSLADYTDGSEGRHGAILINEMINQTYMISAPAGSRWRLRLVNVTGATLTLSIQPDKSRVMIYKVG